MFTGIVEERGRIAAEPEPRAGGAVRLAVAHSRELGRRLKIGASLAVSGVCLTVVERRRRLSTVELSPETLSRTTLGAVGKGSEVNLEAALRVGDALGGHWVQGHVDCTVEVLAQRWREEHREDRFTLPPELEAFVVEKGSVCLDGVSLTVARCAPGSFEVALIPHTLEVTTLGSLRVGDRVNLEIDALAKYVHRALAERGDLPS